MAPVAYGHSQIATSARCRRSTSPAVTRRSEADAALAAAVPEPGLRAFLLQSLAFEDGRARWKLNLEALADQMPRDHGVPRAPPASFAGPTLFLTGASSDYVPPRALAAHPGALPRRRAPAHRRRRPLAARRRPRGVHRGGEAFLA